MIFTNNMIFIFFLVIIKKAYSLQTWHVTHGTWWWIQMLNMSQTWALEQHLCPHIDTPKESFHYFKGSKI